MGQSATAVLFYGFVATENTYPDFGDDCDAADEWREAWGECFVDFLAEKSGILVPEYPVGGEEADPVQYQAWSDGLAAVRAYGKSLRVEAEYQGYDYEDICFAAEGSSRTAYWGDARTIDTSTLDVQDYWDSDLLAVAEGIGFNLDEIQLGWYLIAHYG